MHFMCQYLHVEFIFLDIECCAMCACDNLTVYDGQDNTGLLMTTMCGSNFKTVYNDYYGYGHLHLQFQSDSDVEGTGFKATIKFIENPNAGRFMFINYIILEKNLFWIYKNTFVLQLSKSSV